MNETKDLVTNVTQDEGQPEALKQTKSDYIYDRQQKAFFITINNPETYGYTKDKVIDIMAAKFKNKVYWCQCDEQGSCYHKHIYVLLSKKKRWSAVQNSFPHAHIEATVKGSPEQCRAYIRKEGKFSKEKKETNFPETFYEEGQIPDFFITSDRTEMLQQIDDMLASGMRPNEIMEKSIVFRQYESLIRKHYFAQRKSETPVERPLSFIYHVGASGCGKSYTYVNLVKEHGEDNVYMSADFSNRATAAFDFYSGEKYVVLDEVKPESIPYGMLLTITDKYKQPIHCRYANCWSIYSELHLTSILPPEILFESMVDYCDRKKDPLTQLLRRITKVVYHYKDNKGNYCTYEIDGSEYTSYEDLQKRAVMAQNDGFLPLVTASPFEEQEPTQEKLSFQK